MLRRTGNKKHKNKFPFYCLKVLGTDTEPLPKIKGLIKGMVHDIIRTAQ